MDKHEIDPDRAESTGEGYFNEDKGARTAGCDDDEDRCAVDDYDADPHADKDVPGTADDVPYSLGEQLPDPADQHIIPDETPTHVVPKPRPGSYQEPPEGARDESELWRRQKPLIEEDEDDGYKLEGFEQEEIPGVLDALGEDAAEVLPDAPEGVSSTGAGSEPEHGGFPERDEKE